MTTEIDEPPLAGLHERGAPTAAARRGVEIVVRDLRKSVGDGKTVLHDVSFSVRPGELVAIVGGSGAGKTTLLEALAGVCPADSGIRPAGRHHPRRAAAREDAAARRAASPPVADASLGRRCCGQARPTRARSRRAGGRPRGRALGPSAKGAPGDWIGQPSWAGVFAPTASTWSTSVAGVQPENWGVPKRRRRG